jgi:hypothetical protein
MIQTMQGSARLLVALVTGAILGPKRVSKALALAASAVCLASVSVLAAGNPGRELIPPVPDAFVTCPSGIAAVVHNTIEKEYIKTFTQQDGTLRYGINGRLVVEVTGNRKTLTFNASGPGAIIVRPDGTASIVTEGLTFSIPRANNAIWLFTGRVVFDAATGTILSHSGSTTDVCALLN